MGIEFIKLMGEHQDLFSNELSEAIRHLHNLSLVVRDRYGTYALSKVGRSSANAESVKLTHESLRSIIQQLVDLKEGKSQCLTSSIK